MIETNNTTKRQINEDSLKKIALTVLKGENEQGKELSIALVGPKKMRELNKVYRGHDTVANVLSFPYDSAQGKAETEFGLGEVVLCAAQIQKDAKKYGILFSEAFEWMLIHGILHLLGFDHESDRNAKIMENKERQYCKAFASKVSSISGH